MKPILVTGLLLATLASLGAEQPRKYGVTVTAEKNVDFAKFKTYSWVQLRPSFVKAIDAQIVAATDHELAALGMIKATSGTGDVQVAYTSLTRADADIDVKPDENGLRPQFAVGMLVIAMIEPGTSRRLLELRADLPIDTSPAGLEAAINSAVAEMFAKYPTRRSK